MKLMKGNMWDSKADLICVTGNSTVRNDGRLVMGRGAALEAQRMYPGINLEFGIQIRDWQRRYGSTTPYGVLVSHQNSDRDIGIFQVKWHFKLPAKEELIRNSVSCLRELACSAYESSIIAVNFPGIGYGQLERKDVLPMLKSLPYSVEVWEYT